jgi:hypothetical protein
MEFANTVLTNSFTNEWYTALADNHSDIVTQIQQKKTEPSRNFLQSAKSRDAAFVQVMTQTNVNSLVLRNWTKMTQMTALNGLRNREVALKISTHLHGVKDNKANGFGSEDAWGYIIQSAAASDKAANDMGSLPKSAPTNNVQIKVLNHNGVRFEDQQQQQNVFQSGEDESEDDDRAPAAMTSVMRALDDNRRATESIGKKLDDRGDHWKSGLTCFHCAETGHIATDCQGKCPACQGYRGQHTQNCTRRPRPKGKGKGKGGNNWQDNRRADTMRNGYEPAMDSFGQTDRRQDRQAVNDRRVERQRRSSQHDSDSDDERKRRKRAREDTREDRTSRHDTRSKDKRSRDEDKERSKEGTKDTSRSERTEKSKGYRSSKNESSRR